MLKLPAITPGPWEIVEDSRLPSDLRVYHSNGTGIAKVYGTDAEPNEANAKAIAAVPAMLEALDRADALIENLWKAVPWGETHGLDIAALNEVPTMVKRALRLAGATDA